MPIDKRPFDEAAEAADNEEPAPWLSDEPIAMDDPDFTESAVENVIIGRAEMLLIPHSYSDMSEAAPMPPVLFLRVRKLNGDEDELMFLPGHVPGILSVGGEVVIDAIASMLSQIDAPQHLIDDLARASDEWAKRTAELQQIMEMVTMTLNIKRMAGRLDLRMDEDEADDILTSPLPEDDSETRKRLADLLNVARAHTHDDEDEEGREIA